MARSRTGRRRVGSREVGGSGGSQCEGGESAGSSRRVGRVGVMTMRGLGGVEACAGWEVGGIGLSGRGGRGRSSAAMVAENIIQSSPILTHRRGRSALASNYDLFNNKKT